MLLGGVTDVGVGIDAGAAVCGGVELTIDEGMGAEIDGVDEVGFNEGATIGV